MNGWASVGASAVKHGVKPAVRWIFGVVTGRELLHAVEEILAILLVGKLENETSRSRRYLSSIRKRIGTMEDDVAIVASLSTQYSGSKPWMSTSASTMEA